MKTFVATFYILLSQACGNSLHKIIETLNEGIGTRTCVYYDFRLANSHFYDTMLKGVKLPKILLTQKSAFQLKNQLNAELLTIVMFDNNLKELEMKVLSKSLNRLFYKDLLFVTENDILELDAWLWLFQWCWLKGFYNVILADATGKLLTFEAFPKLQVTNTSVEIYLKQRNKWYNLQGFRIRALYGSDPPLTIIYTTAKSQLVFKGFIAAMLELFTTHYNATLVPRLVNDFDSYTVLDCFKHLQANLVEICADIAPWDETRYVVSVPLYMSVGNLMVRYGQPIDKFLYFIVQFNREVWLLIGVSIFYTTLVLTLICWLQSGYWNIGAFFLQAISSVIYIAFSLKLLAGKSKCILHILLIISGFVLSNFYLALLSSILSTNVYEHQIDSLENLRDQNVTVLANDYIKRIFDLYGIPKIVQQQLLIVPSDIMQHNRIHLDVNYAYYSIMERLDFYMYQQKFLLRPRMKLLKKPIMAMWTGIPMITNWPFEELMNIFNLRLFSSGIYLHMVMESFEEGIRSKVIQFFKTEYYDVFPLTLAYFIMPAMLLGFGYLLGFFALIVENVIHSLKFN